MSIVPAGSTQSWSWGAAARTSADYSSLLNVGTLASCEWSLNSRFIRTQVQLSINQNSIRSSKFQAPIKYHHLIADFVSGHRGLPQGRINGSLCYYRLGCLFLEFLCFFQHCGTQALPENSSLSSTCCIILRAQHIDFYKVSWAIGGLFLEHVTHHSVIVMLFLHLFCRTLSISLNQVFTGTSFGIDMISGCGIPNDCCLLLFQSK